MLRPMNLPDPERAAVAGRVGVLLMAYGTPRRPDEIEAYYTDIRRGRPPTAEALAVNVWLSKPGLGL